MKDFFGQVLEVGDEVAAITTGYADFTSAHVLAILEKKVKLQTKHGPDIFYKFPEQVIKRSP